MRIPFLVWATVLVQNLIAFVLSPTVCMKVLPLCLTFAAEAYLLTLILAGIGAGYVWFAQKQSAQSYFLYVMKNFLLHVLPLLLSAAGYFELKIESVLFRHDSNLLLKVEMPSWNALFCIMPSLPSSLYRILDFNYHYLWFCSHLLIPVLCMSRNRQSVEFFYSTASICYVVCGFLHLVLPVMSPFYVFKRGFSALPHGLHSLSFHEESLKYHLALVHNPSKALNGPGILEVIRAFPSFHVAYAFLLHLWVKRTCRIATVQHASLVYLVLITAGSVLLGYHYISDGLCAFFIVMAWQRLIPRLKSLSFPRL